MATPEQQRRTAEISRVLAANGWGVIAVRDEGAGVTVTVRKPTAAIRAGSVSENMAALRFLVEQFRWSVSAYNGGDVHHEATVSTT
jgi:D-alanyl-D-alanine carboxypeptidase